MVGLINLPGYQPSPLMDFGQINQALQNRQQQQARADQMAMQERQQVEQARQFNAGHQLAVQQRDLAAEKSPYERDLLDAQAKAQRAHAGYYDAQSASAKALANARNTIYQQPDPMAGRGMREDGTIYPMGQGTTDSGRGGVPIDGTNGADDVGGGPADDNINGVGRFGQRGLTARDIPGVVTNGKGASDRLATERALGQSAMESHPDVKRLQQFMETQNTWTLAHGTKPRAGMMYDVNGREVPKGPMSNAADQADRKDRGIASAQAQIVEAEKVLLEGWVPGLGRAVAGSMKDMGTPGRFINNMTGLEAKAEALDKMKHGVLQTVYALSGKQTTNKEMDHFLDLYLPRGGESAELLKSKSARLQAMLTTLQSATRKGMIYEDAERAAISAASDVAKSGGPPASNPVAERMKNKYGLE